METGKKKKNKKDGREETFPVEANEFVKNKWKKDGRVGRKNKDAKDDLHCYVGQEPISCNEMRLNLRRNDG